MKTYKQLANTLLAKRNCKKHKNDEWFIRHGARIDQIMGTAPSGSGFDNGTQLDEKSTPERLVFTFGYHHMEEGTYTHWTHHRVTVRGSLPFAYNIHVTPGVSKREIMAGVWATKVVGVEDKVDKHALNYFYQVFQEWLDSEVVLAKEW